MKWILYSLIGLVLILQSTYWFSDHGKVQHQKLQQEIQQQQSENQQLRLRNERLHAEAKDLKTGTEVLEERARSQLGLIKEGETFYQVIEEKNNKNSNN